MGTQLYTLVVVDMQETWPAANDPRTRSNVASEIKLAVGLGCPVIYCWVPYWGCNDSFPRTHSDLLALTLHHPHAEVDKCHGNDGSPSVLHVCAQRGFPQHRFRVVGVNTSDCVLKLVHGLLARRPQLQVTVVQNACNCLYKPDCWDQFPAGAEFDVAMSA